MGHVAKLLGSSAILLAGIAGSAAAEDEPLGKLQFAAGVSVSGAQIELSYRFRPKLALRGFAGGGLTVFGEGSVGGVDYDWNVSLAGVGLVADYYPWTEGFRISGGLFFPGTRITGRANGDLEIGEGTYEGVTLEGNVTPVGNVLPLVSIGYVQPLSERFSLTADVGAIFTEGFRINLQGTGGPGIPLDDINLEERQFQAQAWDVFPFIALGIAYRF